jgi:hypothetical protein
MIDYFAPAPSPEEEILRRIKGTYRHHFIGRAIEEDGLEKEGLGSRVTQGWVPSIHFPNRPASKAETCR